MKRRATFRIALRKGEPDIHLLLVYEPLAMPVDDHRVRQKVVGGGLSLQAPLVYHRRRSHDQRLIHPVKLRASRFRHTLSVAGIGRWACSPFDRAR